MPAASVGSNPDTPHSSSTSRCSSGSAASAPSIGSGVCLNLAAVGSRVASTPEWASSPQVHLIVMEGIAESLAPAILGLMLLSLAWTIMAAGQRRLARESLLD